jgi:hypothetical protein
MSWVASSLHNLPECRSVCSVESLFIVNKSNVRLKVELPAFFYDMSNSKNVIRAGSSLPKAILFFQQ